MVDVIECLKCDRRFIENRTQEEFESKPCIYCDNKDLKETIVCCPEMYNECDCNDCIGIRKNIKNRNNINTFKQLIIKTYDSNYTIIVMIVIGLIALNIK